MQEAEQLAASRLDPKAWILAALLAALVLAVYSGVGAHDFVDFDDYEYIVENPYLDGRVDLEDLRRAFSEAYKSNWAPIMSLSLATSDALYGPAPGAYARENVILHALAAVLLFLALRRMTGRVWASAFVAAVFGVHPLHVESVAWISERKEVLAGVFWMAALYVYPGWVRSREGSALVLVLLWSSLAMLSKATAVALPVTLLLLDFWPLGRLDSWKNLVRALLEKIPFAVVAVGISAITLYAQTESGANTSAWTPFSLRGMNAARAYAIYLADSFWPAGLAYYYPYPSDEALLAPSTMMMLAGLVLATAVALALWRRAPVVTMGWLWFSITLVPMIGLVRVGGQAHADRYTYIAQTGIALIVAFALPDWISSRVREESTRRLVLRVCAAVGVAIVLGLSIAAHRQVSVWRDSRTLFTHATRVTEDNAHAHRFLGVALWSEGDAEGGEAHLREALRIEPTWGDARLVLATALLQTGRLAEATSELERARRDGADPALSWAATGVLEQQSGREAPAARAYERALELDADDWEVLNNLAWIRAASASAALRDPARAIDLARRAEALRPGNPFVLGTLAGAYASAGRRDEAVAMQQRALEALDGSGDASQADAFRIRLRRYRRGEPAWDAPSERR